jgi:hypothetical protein
MRMIRQILAGLMCQLALVSAALAEERKASIGDFLADTSGGYVGASGIIGLDGKLVRDVATPKELVASVSQAFDKDSKDGLGIAYAPGRSRFERAAIDMTKVESGSDTFGMPPLRRLWGSTTFSYAQNRTTISSAEYKQRALAVNVEYYLHIKDDPTFAAYSVFFSKEDPDCIAAAKASGQDSSKLAEVQRQIRAQVASGQFAALRAASVASAASAAAASASAAAEVPGAQANAKAKAKTADAAASAADADAGAKKAAADVDEAIDKAISSCASKAGAAAKAKWNAPKATLLVGRGQIQGTGPSDPRLSLGHHVQFSLAVSPENIHKVLNEDSSDGSRNQLTLSYNRATNVLDTTTLAATPAYKSNKRAAVRYTRAWDGELTSYLLIEASTAKTSDGVAAAGTYKHAVGWDYKLGANMWLELRYGRSVARTGDKEENKALMTLKFSPEGTLSSLLAPR